MTVIFDTNTLMEHYPVVENLCGRFHLHPEDVRGVLFCNVIERVEHLAPALEELLGLKDADEYLYANWFGQKEQRAVPGAVEMLRSLEVPHCCIGDIWTPAYVGFRRKFGWSVELLASDWYGSTDLLPYALRGRPERNVLVSRNAKNINKAIKLGVKTLWVAPDLTVTSVGELIMSVWSRWERGSHARNYVGL